MEFPMSTVGKEIQKMKRAYVTLLCSGDSYVPGVEALGRSLHESGTRVPLVVLTTPEVPEAAKRQLADAGWELRAIDPIPNPAPNEELLFARYRNTYTKLRAFGLEGIDKAVFLDADTIVLSNVDELFERPAFAAAPDFFMTDRFNSGVMVVEPSPELFARMNAVLHESPTYDGGDQGFLNQFFSDWWNMSAAHRLPARYNMHHFVYQFLTAHASLRRQFEREVKIVHYTLQKPWLVPTLTGGSRLWWRYYTEAHPEQDQAWRRRLHELEDWTFSSLVGALGGP
jgi:alpha-N-acetylglucosamine transferase